MALFSIDDAISVSCVVVNLRNENYDPVLIYKPQDVTTLCRPFDLDVLPYFEKMFVLGIQT